jgi:hypothetical protein
VLEQSVPARLAIWMAFAGRMGTSTDVRRDNGCEAPIQKLHNEERLPEVFRIKSVRSWQFEGLESDFTLQ